MREPPHHELQRAIATISQSDPIPKLLREVRLGRMKPDDAGLRAVTEAWLDTYRQVLESGAAFDHGALMRLDPSPRLKLLIEAGVLTKNHPAVAALTTSFEQRLQDAHKRAPACS